MKKLLLVIAVTVGMLAATKAKAQNSQSINSVSTTIVKKTIAAVDTVVFSSVPDHVKSAQYTFAKVSGTIAGKVYFEVTGDLSGWVIVDSLVLADVTIKQVLRTKIASTDFLACRFRNTNTSAGTGTVTASILRRND